MQQYYRQYSYFIDDLSSRIPFSFSHHFAIWFCSYAEFVHILEETKKYDRACADFYTHDQID